MWHFIIHMSSCLLIDWVKWAHEGFENSMTLKYKCMYIFVCNLLPPLRQKLTSFRILDPPKSRYTHPGGSPEDYSLIKDIPSNSFLLFTQKLNKFPSLIFPVSSNTHNQKSTDLITKSALFLDFITSSALGRSLYSICSMELSRKSPHTRIAEMDPLLNLFLSFSLSQSHPNGLDEIFLQK